MPDVYASMLAETDHSELEHSDRPLKKRKVTPKGTRAVEKTVSTPSRASKPVPAQQPSSAASIAAARPISTRLQTVEDSSDDESEFEFEDVDLEGADASADEHPDGIEDLSISVQPESSIRRAQNRRKPATSAEKAHRLLVHKLHILCLLGHCMYVNGRCNNATVHKLLRRLLSARAISYLNPKTEHSQFQRNRSFLDGLQQATDAFNGEYHVTASGMIKPIWTVDGEEPRELDHLPPVDRSDFVAAAKNMEGSQDMGNQLFCAMLRSAGVDARVVCSLQVLPFTSVPKGSTPQKPVKERILAIAPDTDLSKTDSSADESAMKGSSRAAIRRRLGQPGFTAPKTSATPPKKKSKHIPKLSYPVFWVEAFNAAHQKWVPVDPVVTHSVNKPAKLEPPISYDLNQMTYVLGFEADGITRDVTKRYAKAYNAKTRRHRVEASKDGSKWFKKAMRIFRRKGGANDRDQVEDAELAQKEAREGMPANVLDFKDHPYYALERHLKRHEVLHPKREVGKVNAGTAAKPRMEAVYRRQDVQICKSADKWYRVGREVLEGEQPLKHVPARRKRFQTPDDEDAEPDTTPMYAPYQTQLYIPPPVDKDRIPKNVYGNLDIYVPSMVPAGAVHLRAPRGVFDEPTDQDRKQFTDMAQRAAKLLRIDYADAVTGFKFQGRTGTATVDGVVVAQEYADAVRTAIEGFEYEAEEDASKARSLLALKLWKRFLTGLRIAEQVREYGDGTEDRDAVHERIDAAKAAEEGPGMFLEGSEREPPLITAGLYTIEELLRPGGVTKQRKRKKIDEEDDELMEYEQHDGTIGPDFGIGDEGGGFFPEHRSSAECSHGGGGFLPEAGEQRIFHEEDGGFVTGPEPDGTENGGGFMVDNDDGGGFIADEADDESGLIPHDETQDGGFVLDDEPEGGGFLPDADASHNDDKSIAAGDESQQFSHDSAMVQEIRQTEQDASALQEIPKTSFREPAGSHPSQQTDAAELDSGNDSDKGSLLSHDPEDDDAEPDWLLSD